jgi:phosphoribosyl 1,2-cyclic phosphodiesterase
MPRGHRDLLGDARVERFVKIRIWGCRGSIATPGAGTIRYGGNTSCVEVLGDGGEVIVLDAGTGARPLGNLLMREPVPRVDLLLTHLHVDHLEGLGMFGPIWSPETELHIWGPPSPVASLDERIATYFSPPLFPVHLSEVPSRVSFHDAPREPWTIGSVTLTAHPILHPGATVGYRLESRDRALAYVTDHEPALGTDLDAVSTSWISGYALAHRADLLIHDCQYTEQEYAAHVGWGHPSVAHVASFARRAEVDRLVMFHHHPEHDDDELDAMRGAMLEAWPVEPGRCIMATEGVELEV